MFCKGQDSISSSVVISSLLQLLSSTVELQKQLQTIGKQMGMAMFQFTKAGGELDLAVSLCIPGLGCMCGGWELPCWTVRWKSCAEDGRERG